MGILIIQKTLIYAIPLLIVALGGMFAERSGVINLALEGQMIFGGLFGAIFVHAMLTNGILVESQQLLFVLAIIVAGISGAIFSLLLSFSAVTLKADQTIGGTALNMLAPALVCTLGLSFYIGEKVSMPPNFNFVIKNPDVSKFWQIFVDKAYISTYLMIAIFIILSIWIYKTKTGTRMRACGEHPQAAASVGVNVYKMRYLGTTISGFLAGMGGYVYIATTQNGAIEGTVAGMGFLALAIMIFGNWKPLGIALGALMFGFLKCIGPLASGIEFLAKIGLPNYFYNIIPYLVVLIVLAIGAKKSGVPKAEGIPYDPSTR
ncbi:MAG: ABC transporter permease [Clostridia bacterium]|nr:ABC transporter permease [Clostridia bacterium]